ncbi:MAG: peptidoglycan-binding protein, partial [Pseudomonadota bacterium]
MKKLFGIVLIALVAAVMPVGTEDANAQIKILKRLGNGVYIGRLPDGRIVRVRLKNRGKRRGRTVRQRTRSAKLNRSTRRQVQRRLNELGFNAGPADGAFGRGTRAAIRRFQRSIGARATGRLSSSQLSRLLNGGGAPSSVPQVQQAAAMPGNYIMLPDTDLPGHDYRNPNNDRSLRGLSEQACAATCNADSSCRAFTYNRNASFCWLKSGHGSMQRHVGAYSGIKQGAAPQSRQASAGATRSGSRTTTRTIAQIRKDAVRFGGDCSVEAAAINRLRAGTKVTYNRLHASIGQTIALDWQTPQLRERLPVYLMASFDQPVRFKGKGFYALLPDSRAAFGIEWNKDKTRAIVPLYGDGAATSGRITVEPILARQLKMSWSVVGYLRRCEKADPGTEVVRTAAISASTQPQIVQDEDAVTAKPKRVYRSADGTRLIEDFETNYNIVDATTGARIINRAGTDPVFSPSGRFITARSEDGVDVVDAIDGKTVGGSGEIGWRNGDSVMVSGVEGWGIAALSFPLIEKNAFKAGDSCRICRGLESNHFFADLENNAFYSSNKTVTIVSRLDTGRQVHKTEGDFFKVNSSQARRSRSRAARVVRDKLGVMAFRPQDQDLTISRTKFTHLLQGFTTGGGTDVTNDKLARARIPRRPLQAPPRVRTASLSGTANWRGLSRVLSAVSGRERIERLADMGIVSTRPAAPVYERGTSTSVFVREGDANRITARETDRIAQEILRTVPQAKGVFNKPSYTTACYADKGIVKQFDRVTSFQVGERRLWFVHRNCVEGSAAFNYPTIALFDSSRKKGWFAEFDLENGSNVATGCSQLGFCDIALALVSERYLVMWSRETRAVAVFDLETYKTIFRRYNLERGDLLQTVMFSPERNQLTQVNTDGSFYVYRMKDWARVLEGRYVDDEVIVWTPNGHYDATSEGAHFVKIRFPGELEQYSFQQFEKKLRVPGLVRRLLDGETLKPVKTHVPPSLAATFEATPGGRIVGQARARSGKDVAGVNIYQDGVLSDRLSPGADGNLEIDVARLPGARWVSAVAVDSAGLASLPKGLDLGKGEQAGRIHTLTVGVNTYTSRDITRLSFAKADAELLSKSFKQGLGDHLAAGTQVLLTDEKVTRVSILEAAERIVADARAGETIAVSFAGHGLKDRNGKFFLATHDTSLGDLAGTALAWDELAEVLS